jgi:hypothetical protein
MGREQIPAYFSELETTKEHHGYFCSVGEAMTIVIMGSIAVTGAVLICCFQYSYHTAGIA